MATDNTATPAPIKIKVSQIQTDLQAGLKRKDIRAKYNLSHGAMKQLFKHPALAAKRANRSGFELEDDVTVADAGTSEASTSATFLSGQEVMPQSNESGNLSGEGDEG